MAVRDHSPGLRWALPLVSCAALACTGSAPKEIGPTEEVPRESPLESPAPRDSETGSEPETKTESKNEPEPEGAPGLELDCSSDADCTSVALTLSGPQSCCFRCSNSAANLASRDALVAWCESQPVERDCPKKKCAKPWPTEPRCVEGQCELVGVFPDKPLEQ